jgi:hypothetical protein
MMTRKRKRKRTRMMTTMMSRRYGDEGERTTAMTFLQSIWARGTTVLACACRPPAMQCDPYTAPQYSRIPGGIHFVPDLALRVGGC